jgi:hypothetical protein
MRIVDSNYNIIYECSLKGETLHKFWAEQCKLGWSEYCLDDTVLFTAVSGSIIMDFGNLSYSSLGIDEKRVVELAARKHDYLVDNWNVKPYLILNKQTIMFTEL